MWYTYVYMLYIYTYIYVLIYKNINIFIYLYLCAYSCIYLHVYMNLLSTEKDIARNKMKLNSSVLLFIKNIIRGDMSIISGKGFHKIHFFCSGYWIHNLVSVCDFGVLYVYICVDICVYIYVWIYVYICICIYVLIRKYMYVSVYILAGLCCQIWRHSSLREITPCYFTCQISFGKFKEFCVGLYSLPCTYCIYILAL